MGIFQIDLNDKEFAALTELAKLKGTSNSAVLKQAFLFYQTIEKKRELGQISESDLNNLLNRPKLKIID